jgi:predicted RNase H-like HicB family nuclease
MTSRVGTRWWLNIHRTDRQALRIEPGMEAVQIVVDGHLAIYFLPAHHTGSLFGTLPRGHRWRPVIGRGLSAASQPDSRDPGDTHMAREFTVVIERDEDGYLVGSVPSLPGCHTQARAMDELLERIKEAIQLCLEVQGDEEETEALELVGIQRVAV